MPRADRLGKWHSHLFFHRGGALLEKTPGWPLRQRRGLRAGHLQGLVSPGPVREFWESSLGTLVLGQACVTHWEWRAPGHQGCSSGSTCHAEEQGSCFWKAGCCWGRGAPEEVAGPPVQTEGTKIGPWGTQNWCLDLIL